MIITILRKPLEGSVADNTLKHGCGGINIDATRVSTQDVIKNHSQTIKSANSKNIYSNFKGQGTYQTEGQKLGRFPANFILTHLEGCELKGTRKVKGHKNSRGDTNQGFGENGIYRKTNPTKLFDYTDEDGKEAVADWDCVEGCPVKELDSQSGVSKSTGGRIGNKGGAYSHLGETGFKDNAVKGDPGFGDEGGASRFFKQFQITGGQ